MQDETMNSIRSMRIAIIALAVVLAVVAVVAATSLLTVYTMPQATESTQQEHVDRTKNTKKDALLVDLGDQNARANQPGIVATDNVKSVANLPASLMSGGFYALWDCEILDTNGSDRARLLVTMREVQPVAGRVWMNWYIQDHWSGWQSLMPR